MERDEILKHRLADVRWPTVRIRNALINEWPEGTLGDLILTTRVEMLRVPNFGRRSFEKTAETLAEFGLAFADGSKPEKIADLCPDCGGPMIACRSAEGTRYFYCATLDSTRKKAGASAG
jgi:hypothetical protein